MRFFVCLTCLCLYPFGVLHAQSAEALLDAQGVWVFVDEKRKADPIADNMKARGDVDPQQISRKNKYAQDVAQTHVDAQDHIRVLRVNQGDARGGLYTALGQTQPSAGGVEPPLLNTTRIENIRKGDHGAKTRFVLDLNTASDYVAAFQNENRILVVTLPHSTWQGMATQTYPDDALVQGYRFRANGDGGSSFIVELKQPGKLVAQHALAPEDGYKNHRIVLDIAAL
ncbi:MAG: hypothetical protein ACPGRX_08850 [Bdellovibrionales bacterium]